MAKVVKVRGSKTGPVMRYLKEQMAQEEMRKILNGEYIPVYTGDAWHGSSGPIRKREEEEARIAAENRARHAAQEAQFNRNAITLPDPDPPMEPIPDPSPAPEPAQEAQPEPPRSGGWRNIVFDSQILSSLQKCPYYLNLAFMRRLGVEHKAQALESGDLLHTMMKVFYTLKIQRPDLPYEQYIEHSKQIGREKAITLAQELETSEEVSYHFEEYCKFREGEFWIPKAVEKSFTILLHESEEDNLRIYYEGIIDLVVDSEAGEAVVDHKSSRRNMPNPNIELSNQFMGYCYSLGINTAVINKVGFQKTLKPAERFTRVPLSYSNAQLAAWRDNTIWWAKQLAWFVDNNTFPQNFTGCDKYSGCIFGEACKTDPGAAREFVLENHYKELPAWNPHTRDKELDERIARIVQEA